MKERGCASSHLFISGKSQKKLNTKLNDQGSANGVGCQTMSQGGKMQIHTIPYCRSFLLHEEECESEKTPPRTNACELLQMQWEGLGLPWWLRWLRICLQCRRPEFDLSVGKIPWRRKWQPTPVFLPRESPRTEEPGGPQSMGSQRLSDYTLTLADNQGQNNLKVFVGIPW